MKEWIMKYWIECGFGVIVFLIGVMYKRLSAKLKTNRTEYSALKGGMKALLHNEIMKTGKQLINQGYCTSEEFEEFEDLYIPYHDGLQGNGSGTRMYEQVKRLPQRPGNDEGSV